MTREATRDVSTPAEAPDHPSPPAPPPPPNWWRWLIPLGVLLTGWLLAWPLVTGPLTDPPEALTYSEFAEAVDDGQVRAVTIRADGHVAGELADGRRFTTTVPVDLAGQPLLDRLEARDVEITAVTPGPSLLSVLLSFAPFLALLALYIWLGRRAGGQFAQLTGFGRSGARIFDTERPDTTFDDVAGYEAVKGEISEIVAFLQEPERFRRVGAAIPRGVLMVGPPGTGKTLLARALAGEAGVPFLSVTGSSFVEMLVGVGAARVRDLFAEARKRAPAIIFIDEIDAIGHRRASGTAVVSNDEREQTLNQLLAEMDGFDPAAGVIVLAATNRPEVLDPALLRPGRFDRQVTVPLPGLDDRRAILAVHTGRKRLDNDVDLGRVARATPGFSGADLANLVNEAAINAARAGRDTITDRDLDTARDRILLGQRQASNALTDDEKRIVAVHEAGHALVATLCEHADPVDKVTILPAGQALGATHQIPEDERRLFGERHLKDRLATQLGGRAAELEVLGEASTGAANDLAQATQLAGRMVREYGLSREVGPVGLSGGRTSFLGDGSLQPESRTWSEATQQQIDSETIRLLREAEERARQLVADHRHKLDRLVELLLEHETIDGDTVRRVIGRDVLSVADPPEPAITA